MKYARVREGKIIKIGSVNFPDSLPVINGWVYPTEYPVNFYNVGHPVNTIEGAQVTVTKSFTLKTVEALKAELYEKQKQDRQVAQLGEFISSGITVILKDREDSIIINGLSNKDKNFKVGQGQWTRLSGMQIQQLKDDHEAHVQSAYNTEMTGNNEVSALTTHDELRAYIEA